MLSDDDISEEILEDIAEPLVEDLASLKSFGEDESFQHPSISLHTGGQDDIVDALFLRRLTEDKDADNNLLPVWQVRGNVSNQRACLDDISDCIDYSDSTSERHNESEKEKEEEEENEKGTKYVQSKSKSQKGLSHGFLRQQTVRSTDLSPVSSDWSVESFRTNSSNTCSGQIKDRSVSEISVSVPKLSIVNVCSDQKVSSLVKQFSLPETSVAVNDCRLNSQHASLPTTFSCNVSSENFEKTDVLLKDNSNIRKNSVTSLVSHFNVHQEEKVYGSRKLRNSPRRQVSHQNRTSSEELSSLGILEGSLSGRMPLNSARDGKTLKDKENMIVEKLPKETTLSQNLSKKNCSSSNESNYFSRKTEEDSISEKLSDLCEIAFLPPSSEYNAFPQKSFFQKREEENYREELNHTKGKKCKKMESCEHEGIDACDTEEEVDEMPDDKCYGSDSFDIREAADNGKKISRWNSSSVWPTHSNLTSSEPEAVPQDLENCSENSEGNTCKKQEPPFSLQGDEDQDSIAKTDSLSNVGSFQSEPGEEESNSNSEKDQEAVGKECLSLMRNDENLSVSSNSRSHSYCDELMQIDFDEISDDSEFILGILSKSPISAITERTEESGQENELSKPEIEEESLPSEEDVKSYMPYENSVDESVKLCQNNESKLETESAMIRPSRHRCFPSLPVDIGNDINSSHFSGISLQEETTVQMQPSIEACSETVNPHSSQSSITGVNQKGFVTGAKPKLPLLTGRTPLNRSIEKCSTPPLSPTSKVADGPIRSSLHRVASRSMHNLSSSHSSRVKTHGLQNRSLSLSTDNLDKSSPRAKSLSPGPIHYQKSVHGQEGEGHGNWNRRCISAIALNEGDSQISFKKHKSISLSRLNRSSRSSSMTSISSYKKFDYSHVQSKVRQYIKDMKEKDLRNSTRSLPSTPARRSRRSSNSDIVIVDEKLLRDLARYEEDNMPDDIRRLRDQVMRESRDPKRLEQILKLLVQERKLRYASDTTLATLQLRYDDLNALYAEKQNEVDRLRFFKDNLSKEYSFLHRPPDERFASGRSSCHTTPPNTPNRSPYYHNTSANLSRRSSQLFTPTSISTNRSPSPTASPSHVAQNNSTQVLDLVETPGNEPSGQYQFHDSLPGELARCAHSTASEKSRDVEIFGGITQEDATLQLWITSGNSVLKRIKEFTLLERSAALARNERTIIWQSILNQYWKLSSDFPMVSLLTRSNKSGVLLQEIGQALQVTASRFDLPILPGKFNGKEDMARVSPKELIEGDTVQIKENKRNIENRNQNFDNEGSSSHAVKAHIPDVSYERKPFPLLDIRKDVCDIDSDVKTKGCSDMENVKKENSEQRVGGSNVVKGTQDRCCKDTKQKSNNSFVSVEDKTPEFDNLAKEKNQVGTRNEDVEFNEMNSLNHSPNILSRESSLKIEHSSNKQEFHVTDMTDEASEKSVGVKSSAEESDMLSPDEIQVQRNNDLIESGPTSLTRERSNSLSSSIVQSQPNEDDGNLQNDSDNAELTFMKEEGKLTDICSPARSRESMKTVGPLEKVKLWQESLIDPDVPHMEYKSSSDSPAPSVLTLDSSQPFDVQEKNKDCLDESVQVPTGGADLELNVDVANCDILTQKNLEDKEFENVIQTGNINTNLLLTSRGDIECDLPKSLWRNISVTPRMLGKTVKPRDLDSGCPGSERSTRMSQNASLDQPDQLDLSNYPSSYGAAINVGNIPSAEDVKSQSMCQCVDVGYNRHSKCKLHSYRDGKRLSANDHSSGGMDGKQSANISPSNDLLTLAFSDMERRCENKDIVSSSSVKGSAGNPYFKGQRSRPLTREGKELESEVKLRLERPWSSGNCSNRIDSRVLKDNELLECTSPSEANRGFKKSCHTRSRSAGTDSSHKRQRSKSRRPSEKTRMRNCSRSPDEDHIHRKTKVSQVSPCDDFNRPNSSKYSTRYVSGNTSDLSDASISSMNMSVSDVYSKLSHLERNYKILNLQMKNLTSEVFHGHKKKNKEKYPCGSLDKRSVFVRQNQAPIKALNSVYSSSDDSDVSLDMWNMSKDRKFNWSSPKRDLESKHERSFNSRRGRNLSFSSLYRNVKEPESDASFISSSYPMSSSMFHKSKMEKVPKSTPKDPAKVHPKSYSKGHFAEKNIFDAEDKAGERICQKLVFHSEEESVSRHDVSDESQRVHPAILIPQKVAPPDLQIRNAAVQTDCELLKPPTARLSPISIPSHSPISQNMDAEAAMTGLGQASRSTTPIIYIQNYNCSGETSRAVDDNEQNNKLHHKNLGSQKPRRSNSYNNLRASLDEATSLAEKLRLRSETILAHLNLHIAVQSKIK